MQTGEVLPNSVSLLNHISVLFDFISLKEHSWLQLHILSTDEEHERFPYD